MATKYAVSWGQAIWGRLSGWETGEEPSLSLPWPEPVVNLENLTQVVGSGFTGYGLKSDGTLWGWGGGYAGGDGQGLLTVPWLNKPIPARVAGGLPLYTEERWEKSFVPGALPFRPRGPLGPRLGTISKPEDGYATAIAASGASCWVLLSTGKVVTWGGNAHAMLGNGWKGQALVEGPYGGVGSQVVEKTHHDEEIGIYEPQWAPGYVLTGGQPQEGPVGWSGPQTGANALTNVKAIAAGWSFCVYLRENGEIWFTGWMGGGNNPTEPSEWFAQKVAVMEGKSGPGAPENAVAIAASKTCSLALMPNKQVIAFGSNSEGQFGNGAAEVSGVSTATVLTAAGTPLKNVIAIACGEFHCTALTSDGKVFSWGRDKWGECGQPQSSHTNRAKFTMTATQTAGSSILTGVNESTEFKILPKCEVEGAGIPAGTTLTEKLAPGEWRMSQPATSSKTGAVTMWTFYIVYATQVAGLPTPTGENEAIAIAASGEPTLESYQDWGSDWSMCLLRNGKVYGWGRSNRGQVADLTVNPKYEATLLVNLSGVSAIAAAGTGGYAIIDSGTPWPARIEAIPEPALRQAKIRWLPPGAPEEEYPVKSWSVKWRHLEPEPLKPSQVGTGEYRTSIEKLHTSASLAAATREFTVPLEPQVWQAEPPPGYTASLLEVRVVEVPTLAKITTNPLEPKYEGVAQHVRVSWTSSRAEQRYRVRWRHVQTYQSAKDIWNNLYAGGPPPSQEKEVWKEVPEVLSGSTTGSTVIEVTDSKLPHYSGPKGEGATVNSNPEKLTGEEIEVLVQGGYEGAFLTRVILVDPLAGAAPPGEPHAPVVSTEPATAIGQTAATLNAFVNPEGANVTVCEFEWGTTTSYGSKAVASPSPGGGTSNVAVSAALSGLTAGTTYHFRVTATNEKGTTKGADRSFTALAVGSPTAQSEPASNIALTAAQLNATVNPNGSNVSSCIFEWGLTTAYGKTATANPSPGAGSAPVAVSAALSGLAEGTTYHFRIKAVNAGGTSLGGDASFITAAPPPPRPPPTPSAGMLVREKPPLRLNVQVTTPSGRHQRWASDDPDPIFAPKDMSFGTAMPGGFDRFNGTLERNPRRAFADDEPLSTLTALGVGGSVAWQGRIEKLPDTAGYEAQESPEAVGWQVHLEDDQSVREIYVDGELSKWQPSTPQRKLNMQNAPAAGRQIAGIDTEDASVGTGPEPDLLPALITQLTGQWKRRRVSDAWYDAKGIPLGMLYAAWKVQAPDKIGDDTVSLDPRWIWRGFVLDDDVATAYDYSVNGALFGAAGTSSFTLTPTTATRRWALAELYYDTNVEGQVEQPEGAGTDGVQYPVYWTALAVYGRSGIGLYGDGSAPFSVLASDVISHAVGTWAPKLAVRVRPSSFKIPQLAFLDPTTVAEVIKQASRFELLDWAVWEGSGSNEWMQPTFYLNKRGEGRRRKWRARVGPAQLQETGPQVSRMWNGVAVQFTDVAGKTQIVGPTGMYGATVTYPSLAELDPRSPVNEIPGLRKWALLKMGTTSVEGARVIGERFLQEQKTLDLSGQATIVGHVEDEAGTLWPAWMIRAGDEISFTDAAITTPRRIVSTSYSDATRQNALQLEQPPDHLQAVLERLSVSLVPLGVT